MVNSQICSGISDNSRSIYGKYTWYFAEESEFLGFLGISAHAHTVYTMLSFPLPMIEILGSMLVSCPYMHADITLVMVGINAGALRAVSYICES